MSTIMRIMPSIPINYVLLLLGTLILVCTALDTEKESLEHSNSRSQNNVSASHEKGDEDVTVAKVDVSKDVSERTKLRPLGRDGSAGSKGKKGEPGKKDRCSCARGQKGDIGLQGITGPPGSKGEPGPPGKDVILNFEGSIVRYEEHAAKLHETTQLLGSSFLELKAIWERMHKLEESRNLNRNTSNTNLTASDVAEGAESIRIPLHKVQSVIKETTFTNPNEVPPFITYPPIKRGRRDSLYPSPPGMPELKGEQFISGATLKRQRKALCRDCKPTKGEHGDTGLPGFSGLQGRKGERGQDGKIFKLTPKASEFVRQQHAKLEIGRTGIQMLLKDIERVKKELTRLERKVNIESSSETTENSNPEV